MKRLIALVCGSISTLLLPALVFAQESIDPCKDNPGLTTCQASGIQIGSALGTVIQFLFVIAVILALGFLVYGGIRWITSGGDKGGVETARNTIIAAIVGLIVVFLAYVVLNLVLTFLTGSDISQIKIPQLGGCSVKAGTTPDTDISDGDCNQPTNPNSTFTCVASSDKRSCVPKAKP